MIYTAIFLIITIIFSYKMKNPLGEIEPDLLGFPSEKQFNKIIYMLFYVLFLIFLLIKLLWNVY